MEKKIENKKNIKRIFEMANNLIKLSPYIKNKEIIVWIKEDIREIYLIHKELQLKKQLKIAYEIKDITMIEIEENENIEKKILKVYNIINKELNNWRKVNIEINI